MKWGFHLGKIGEHQIWEERGGKKASTQERVWNQHGDKTDETEGGKLLYRLKASAFHFYFHAQI